MEDIQLKSRAQGAVDSERMQLLCVIAHHWEELERYEYGGGTPKQKWDLWDAIGSEFNSHPSVTITRTPLQVKTLFKNMKTKARKYKMKLDSSRLSGVPVETDPVSETVLQLTRFQSKPSLFALVESLKNIRHFEPKENNKSMSTSPSDRLEIMDSEDMPDSPEWKMASDSDDVPDIKDEVIEAFDSPCIIKEDQSPLSFPSNEEKSENSSDPPQTSESDNNAPSHPESSNSSEIHTFGDISVTPISTEKKTQNGLKILSPVSLGITQEQQNSPITNSTPISSTSTASKRLVLQPKSTLNHPMAVGFVNLSNLIEREAIKRPPGHTDSNSKTKTNVNTSVSVSDKMASNKSCCCPNYHKQMLNLSQKEHEMTLSLLNEKILAKREERRLHEEERKFREQNFLLKQEERRASLAEHQARMKLIELECESVKKGFEAVKELVNGC